MRGFFRNFRQQRTVGWLNICSLSLGIMVAVVVGLWSINELSFDRFHKNRDRIYRVVLNATLSGSPAKLAVTFKALGEQAKDELPAIEDMCRVFIDNADISIDHVLHLGVKAFMTDSNFFTFFTFLLKEGDPVRLLSAPNLVVISESAAHRYFPGQDPIGEMIQYQSQDFTVSGIMKDIPKNSSLQADFIFPFFGRYATLSWGDMDAFLTFFLLQEGVMPETLEDPLTQIGHKGFEIYKNIDATYTMESINNMHFSTQTMFDPVEKGNKSLVMTFVLTVLVILALACINFANLFVSTSFIRAKSIGIKKVMGAKRVWLMREFYGETVCYVLLSIIVGLFIASAVIPTFNDFTQSQLSLDFGSPQIYIFLAMLLGCVVLLAGSFPALYMTRFGVFETLAGKFKGKKLSLLQRSLVITQFTASITLLIVVTFMQKQVNYLLTYDLGFNKEHVLYVYDRGRFDSDYRLLENEFLREPSISGVTRKNSLPTQWVNGWSVKQIPQENAMPILMEACRVSPNYFDLLEMKIVEGTNPFFLESSLENDVVINESAALALGYESPVGRLLELDGGGGMFTIRGVVQNAHTKSLHQQVDPQLYFKFGHELWEGTQVTFFKIEGNPQRAIDFIGQKWSEKDAEYPFIYNFLDDTYKELYTSEVNAGKVFSFAMLIALMITIAGLFAMVYYATQRRVREIALHKIHGATVREIFVLLNRDFLLWVGIAFAIACPVAYYGMQRWLSGFAVKTQLSAWMFLMVGIMALLITLLTTGYQTWKVATANPVEAIKSE